MTLQGAVHARLAESLGFHTPLPPEQVYKNAPDQVLITDWRKQDDDFVLAARLPLEHPRYCDTLNDFHDVVLFAEVLNQAGVIVASNLLQLPAQTRFLLRRFTALLDPLEANVRSAESVALTLTMNGRSSFKARRDGRSTSAVLATDCCIDGRPSGHSEVTGAFVPEEVYTAFREGTRALPGASAGASPSSGAPELLTGRANPRNAVIEELVEVAAGVYSTRLIVPVDDPSFFDLPLDHVPGLLMLEAARQATTAALCRARGVPADRLVVVCAEATFSRFGELGAPVECVVEPAPRGRRVDVEFLQAGKRLCRMELHGELL